MTGEVVYFYAFDVANEILLERIGTLRGRAVTPYLLPAMRGVPRHLPFRAPLHAEIPVDWTVGGTNLRVDVRVYSVGVLSIVARLSFRETSLRSLFPYHALKLDHRRTLDQAVRELGEVIRSDLEGVLVQPASLPEPEAYTAFCIADLDGAEDSSAWLIECRAEVAGLLAETEPSQLSDSQIVEVLRQRRSFLRTDLVVIDWDAALVIDLREPMDDILYVLELANLQLEEFRMMDQTLDQYLSQAYEHLESRGLSMFGLSSSMLRKLRRFRVDVTHLADEVTHITKLFGDWYLARVYLAARERFHLDSWRSSVDGRLDQLDRLYSVLHADQNEQRMFVLEVMIVVLFVIDIVGLFLFKN